MSISVNPNLSLYSSYVTSGLKSGGGSYVNTGINQGFDYHNLDKKFNNRMTLTGLGGGQGDVYTPASGSKVSSWDGLDFNDLSLSNKDIKSANEALIEKLNAINCELTPDIGGYFA